jgi:hypothetical protein
VAMVDGYPRGHQNLLMKKHLDEAGRHGTGAPV